ncbi:zinc finger and BTB domain-containing protein 17 [Anopheles ziemanni]|uniref:zinc finger and BTB domain-containing protein 17 n=1 Tax=Anopheles ziemanni TaxID=345580 RepID=UPI00265FD6DC|nr:zinc finger and BTB domain-containing protein 17 [Anopheles ziemanni]
MANAVCKILDICRFCLLHDDLIPITQAVASMVTVQDIENFTGIQITDEEQLSFAICKNCCKVLENSVAFRNICLNNDVVFKQLFSVVIESIKEEENEDSTQIQDDSSNFESDDQIGAEGPSFDASYSSASDAEDVHSAPVARPITKGLASAKAKGKADEKPNTSTEHKIEKEKTVCYTCGKLVTNLPNHMIHHNKERRYSCPHCPLKMSNGTNMKKHIEAVHEKKIAKSCELCGEGFIHMSTFVRHMTIKHGIGGTYECKICSKTFKQVDRYRHHMNKWHKTRKEHKCTICDKVFNGR